MDADAQDPDDPGATIKRHLLSAIAATTSYYLNSSKNKLDPDDQINYAIQVPPQPTYGAEPVIDLPPHPSTWSQLLSAVFYKSDQFDVNWFNLILSILLIMLMVTTAIGNLFVIVAILVERNLRTIGNYLVLSLAIADLLVACLVMPLAGIYQILERWTLGPTFCDIWTSADVFSCTASILHLLAIALDRYWAVTRVDYIRCQRNERRILFMILFVWMAACIISLAPIFGWKDADFEKRILEDQECLISQDIGYQIFATCTTFYFPLTLTLIFYWKIYQVARKRIRRKPGNRVKISLQHPSSNSSISLPGSKLLPQQQPLQRQVNSKQDRKCQTIAKLVGKKGPQPIEAQTRTVAATARAAVELVADSNKMNEPPDGAHSCLCSCHSQNSVQANPMNLQRQLNNSVRLPDAAVKLDLNNCGHSDNPELDSSGRHLGELQEASNEFPKQESVGPTRASIDSTVTSTLAAAPTLPDLEVAGGGCADELENCCGCCCIEDGMQTGNQDSLSGEPNNESVLESTKVEKSQHQEAADEKQPLSKLESLVTFRLGGQTGTELLTPSSGEGSRVQSNDDGPQQQRDQQFRPIKVHFLSNLLQGSEFGICWRQFRGHFRRRPRAFKPAESSGERECTGSILRDSCTILVDESGQSKLTFVGHTDKTHCRVCHCNNSLSNNNNRQNRHKQNQQVVLIDADETPLDESSSSGATKAPDAGMAIAVSSANIAVTTVSQQPVATTPNFIQYNQYQQQQQQQQLANEGIESKRERKAAKTLAIITGVFVMCWLPFFVMAITMSLLNLRPHKYVFAIMLWLGYVNSMLNPIIYTIFSPDFRKAFKRLLCGLDGGRGRGGGSSVAGSIGHRHRQRFNNNRL